MWDSNCLNSRTVGEMLYKPDKAFRESEIRLLLSKQPGEKFSMKQIEINILQLEN